ncbi:hypothetical protein AeRB84_017572 [Aphanomyces euteiches]|nr:hypothetical protein AeRB84_017572 [Aphanomyces euteiches]
MHQAIYGNGGYDQPGHWCVVGKTVLNASPMDGSCTAPPTTNPAVTPTPPPYTPTWAPPSPSRDPTSGCTIHFDVPPLDACSSKNLLKGGWAPISVRGMHHYCTQVTETHPQFCVANIMGNCPKAQPGLPFGSECQVIPETNVYGCVPRTKCPEDNPPTPQTTRPGCDLNSSPSTTVPTTRTPSATPITSSPTSSQPTTTTVLPPTPSPTTPIPVSTPTVVPVPAVTSPAPTTTLEITTPSPTATSAY